MSRRTTSLKSRQRDAESRASIARAKLQEKAAKLAASRMKGPRAYLDSYDATIRGRTRPGVRGRTGTHDAHLDPLSHDYLRRDSRQLDRNNPIARALIQRLCDAVIGSGFRLRCMSASDEWNTQAQAWFTDWFENKIDVRGLANGTQYLRVLMRGATVDGDLGVMRLDNGQTQLIESDRIRTPADRTPNARYFSGVEMNDAGTPVAFHVAENAGGWNFTLGYTNTKRIPAEYFDFLPNPLHQRIQQTRGEPVLAATMPLLEQLDDLTESTVVNARLASYVALAITSQDPGGLQDGLLNQATAANSGIADGYAAGEAKPQNWQPGSVLHLGLGEDIKTIDPKQPTQHFDAQVRSIIRMVGADIGLPLELSMLDASQTNYHGFKAAIGNAYRGFARWQQWLVAFLRRTYRWRIGMAIIRGELPYIEGWEKTKWILPPPPIIDAKAEYEAAALKINQRLGSREDTVGALDGTDITDLYDQLEWEQDQERTRGIAPVALPGQNTSTPGVQPEDVKPADAPTV